MGNLFPTEQGIDKIEKLREDTIADYIKSLNDNKLIPNLAVSKINI